MAKDPRFNFYPDNWSGGTKRMNFEQKGAYMELLLLNFYCFSDELPGFTEEEALKVLANATAYTELWNFLKPKFKTDGKHFWSERMQREFHKAKKHSEKQTDRANKRWNKQTANATALPVNGYGNGNGSGIGIELKEGVQGEKTPIILTLRDGTVVDDVEFNYIFSERHLEAVQKVYVGIDIADQLEKFKLKVRGSPGTYSDRDSEGLRLAFDYQIRGLRPEKSKQQPKRTEITLKDLENGNA